jgi:hypothetical protein
MSVERLDIFRGATPATAQDAGSVLSRAMLLAQDAADATLAEARADAERIRAEARAEVAQLEGVIAELRDQITVLAARVATTAGSTTQPAQLPRPAAPGALVASRPDVRAEPGGEASGRPKDQAPATVAPTPAQPKSPAPRPGWWRGIPLEAILPIVAIVVVLLVMLALMG